VAGYIPRWFIDPQTVTHPSTIRARRTRRATTLIETNALPAYHYKPGDTKSHKIATLKDCIDKSYVY